MLWRSGILIKVNTDPPYVWWNPNPLRGYPPQPRGAKLIYRNIRPAIVGNRPIEAILFGCKGESYDNCWKRSFMDWYILLSVVRCDFCSLVC
jgi:hypothetical protein